MIRSWLEALYTCDPCIFTNGQSRPFRRFLSLGGGCKCPIKCNKTDDQEKQNILREIDMTVSHLADKYNQLYTEYLNQYRLHKLTSDLSTVEVLFLQSMDVIASILDQNYLTAFKRLINIRKQQVSL